MQKLSDIFKQHYFREFVHVPKTVYPWGMLFVFVLLDILAFQDIWRGVEEDLVFEYTTLAVSLLLSLILLASIIFYRRKKQ